jgi:hypothetical protein
VSIRASRGKGSGKVDQCTPEFILERVRRVFGGQIAFDPCSNPASIVRAEVAIMLPEYQGKVTGPGPAETVMFGDGLAQPWVDRTFVNHPWKVGLNRKWTTKTAFEAIANGNEICALIPSSPCSHWFRDAVWDCAQAVCFLNRFAFLNFPPNPKTGKIDVTDFDVAMAYYGPNRGKFVAAFNAVGTVVNRIPYIEQQF